MFDISRRDVLADAMLPMKYFVGRWPFITVDLGEYMEEATDQSADLYAIPWIHIVFHANALQHHSSKSRSRRAHLARDLLRRIRCTSCIPPYAERGAYRKDLSSNTRGPQHTTHKGYSGGNCIFAGLGVSSQRRSKWLRTGPVQLDGRKRSSVFSISLTKCRYNRGASKF